MHLAPHLLASLLVLGCSTTRPGSPSDAERLPPAGQKHSPQAVGESSVGSPLEERTSDPVLIDANMNGVEDTIDILLGTSEDLDANGIPDDAEAMWADVRPSDD